MTYLEILATIYVIANCSFIISAMMRDKILINQKQQMDSLQKSLNEYKDLNKFLTNFYNSHNANKEAEVNK